MIFNDAKRNTNVQRHSAVPMKRLLPNPEKISGTKIQDRGPGLVDSTIHSLRISCDAASQRRHRKAATQMRNALRSIKKEAMRETRTRRSRKSNTDWRHPGHAGTGFLNVSGHRYSNWFRCWHSAGGTRPWSGRLVNGVPLQCRLSKVKFTLCTRRRKREFPVHPAAAQQR